MNCVICNNEFWLMSIKHGFKEVQVCRSCFGDDVAMRRLTYLMPKGPKNGEIINETSVSSVPSPEKQGGKRNKDRVRLQQVSSKGGDHAGKPEQGVR